MYIFFPCISVVVSLHSHTYECSSVLARHHFVEGFFRLKKRHVGRRSDRPGNAPRPWKIARNSRLRALLGNLTRDRVEPRYI
jgi:hypothetical protein